MEKEKKIAIVVATHKKYMMPDDEMYIPLYVGACRENLSGDASSGKEASKTDSWYGGFARDDDGENISDLNPGFCELTGLFWIWKNIRADYKGLVQYRRHFSAKHADGDDILRTADIKDDLGRIKIFVPKKRNYYIETLYSHYAHTHYAVQLDATKEVIQRLYPDYIKDFDKAVNSTKGYMFNMVIMEDLLFDDYCSWLFDILFELAKELGVNTFSGKTKLPELNIKTEDEATENISELTDIPELSAFQARFYGRISEIIFNVWLENKLRNKVLKTEEIKELGFINLEGEGWGKKATAFLKAKFIGKKYESSF